MTSMRPREHWTGQKACTLRGTGQYMTREYSTVHREEREFMVRAKPVHGERRQCMAREDR